jgi:peroxiredoxin/outer membrane lipoprotein-sorting protein
VTLVTRPAAAEFDLAAFRSEMEKTASAVTSLFAKGTRTWAATRDEKPVAPAVTVDVLLAFQDPMKVRMEIESPLGGKTLLISDGEDVYTFRPDTNEFTQRKVDPADDPTAPQHLDLPTPEDNKKAMLGQMIPFAADPLTYLRSVELDVGDANRPCVVLEQKSDGPNGPFSVTYWVDEQTHVVWRQENRSHQKGPGGQDVDLLITTVYDEVDLNQTIDASLFEFNPMGNAKQVESLTRPNATSASPWLGKPAPDFTLTDLDGINWTLSSLKGRVVLVNFWATWCGPCKMELPYVEKLYEEFQGKGLVVLAISNENPEKIRRYMKAARYEFPALLDTQFEAWGAYRVTAIPSTLIVDRQGDVAEHFVGAQSEQTLRRSLARLGIE